jgi:preprotein translocase subunit SecY
MLEKLAAAWNVPEIRRRISYVGLIFFVYVLALHVPAAGINHAAAEKLIGGGLLGVLDTFSGGALKKFSVIAMGIMPYINASIIFQLLTVALPQLQAIQKEGESGRKLISRYTRYASVGLALVQSFGLYSMFSRGGAIQPSLATMFTTMITLTAGTMFLLWLGEQITEKGIGNGISMIIFVGIVISLPQQILQTGTLLRDGAVSIVGVIFILVLFLATVVGVIYMTQGTRRIPIQHMRKVVGNRMTQGGSAFLPLKINTAGVIPIIFAISIQLFPATLSQFFPSNTAFGKILQQATNWLQPGSNIWASLIFALLVLFFTYFYTAIQYDTVDIADNLKKHGSLIPGIRPGRPTAEYLDKVLTRITLAGALFLAGISLIQYWAPTWAGFPKTFNFSIVGGTSLLIIVGVALETMQAIEAQMAMRNYEGFIKRRGDDSDNMMRGRAR